MNAKRKGRPRQTGEREPSGRLLRQSSERRMCLSEKAAIDGRDHAIYVIAADETAVKIGISRDPSKRVRALRTGSLHSLSVFMAWRGTKTDVRRLEKAVHIALRVQCGAEGEWFFVAPEPACLFLENAARELGITLDDDLAYGRQFRGDT